MHNKCPAAQEQKSAGLCAPTSFIPPEIQISRLRSLVCSSSNVIDYDIQTYSRTGKNKLVRHLLHDAFTITSIPIRSVTDTVRSPVKRERGIQRHTGGAVVLGATLSFPRRDRSRMNSLRAPNGNNPIKAATAVTLHKTRRPSTVPVPQSMAAAHSLLDRSIARLRSRAQPACKLRRENKIEREERCYSKRWEDHHDGRGLMKWTARCRSVVARCRFAGTKWQSLECARGLA